MRRYFGLHTLEQHWHARLPRYRLLTDRIHGRRVLDIGCHDGIGASLLVELGADEVIGIDHRSDAIELAKLKHDKSSLEFRAMFWTDLDFPDNSIDVVLCLDHRLPVTDSVLLDEVRRVLKEDGEYICAVEKTGTQGIESLLAPNPSVATADVISHKAPQIFELKQRFDQVAAMGQSPVIGFEFTGIPAGSNSSQQNENTNSFKDDEQPETESALRTDAALGREEEGASNIEIWFCGSDENALPPSTQVRLPYFSLVSRLRTLAKRTGDYAQSYQDQSEAEDYRPGEWDDTPTGVRSHPNLPPSPVNFVDKSIDELTHLYEQARTDFQSVLNQAESALAEREEYIQHLVTTIHSWQRQALNHSNPGDRETTQVFKSPGEQQNSSDLSSEPDRDFVQHLETGEFRASDERRDGDPQDSEKKRKAGPEARGEEETSDEENSGTDGVEENNNDLAADDAGEAFDAPRDTLDGTGDDLANEEAPLSTDDAEGDQDDAEGDQADDDESEESGGADDNIQDALDALPESSESGDGSAPQLEETASSDPSDAEET
jgi:SAM-dependent methyltransferase